MDPSVDIDALPENVRDELARLEAVNRSTQAYARLLEGALRAAWIAGEVDRARLESRSEEQLDAADRARREAWELAREVVIRLPSV